MDTSRLPEPLRLKLESRLAQLPPEIRTVLEARLARLPAAQLEQALDRAAPLIDKLTGAAKRSGSSGATFGAVATATADELRRSGGGTIQGAARSARAEQGKSHYNATIQRGDAHTPPMTVMVAVVAAVAFVTWALGWWSV